MKLLKILTIVALMLFPFGELLRFDVGNHIVVKPVDVVVGLAAIVFLLKKNYQVIKSSSHQVIKWVIVFSLVGLGSLLLNISWLKPNEVVASAMYLVRWVSYAALAGVVMQFDEKFKKRIAVFLFFDGLIILLIGFFQYFFFNSLKSLYYLGWDDHMHRIFSVFLDPNFAGGFFVLFFFFLGGALYQHIRNKEYQESKFLGFLSFLTLIAIFLTFSRAALLMLIAGTVVFLILIKKKKLLLVFTAILLLYVAIASPKFYDENMNLFRVASSKARLGNYGVAWTIIQDKPLLGVGFNTYRYAKLHYGYREEWSGAPSHADAGVDNSVLFVLATTGIIGLIAYCALLITVLKRAFALHKKGNMLATVVIASSVALFVNAMFINSLFFPAFMLWMWVLVGLQESA